VNTDLREPVKLWRLPSKIDRLATEVVRLAVKVAALEKLVYQLMDTKREKRR
jgi:outer membrane murein-binding lipoprotein Lpp